MGRPTKFNKTFVARAKALAERGATDREIASSLGVSESTLYEWKHEYPEFSEAIKTGKEPADDRVEMALYRKATGYSFNAVKIFMPAGATSPVYADYVEHVPPSDTAAIFWLKNRRPDRWRDVKATELTGPDGGAIPIQAIERRIVHPSD